MFGIYLSEAFDYYRFGKTFDITYRKKDGSYGQKTNVRKQITSQKNSNEKKEASRKAGWLKLQDSEGNKFIIYVCLWHTINGKTIDKRF